MSALLPSSKELPQTPGEDLSSRLVPIQAHDLKNNAWVLDDKTGLPGTVSDLKMSKTGKHGHAKFTYKCAMPFSGRNSSLMHPGGDRLLRPVMEKMEYEVMDYQENELSVLDGDDEKIITLHRESELGEKVAAAIDDGKLVVISTLVGPQKKGDSVVLIEMPTMFKTQDD